MRSSTESEEATSTVVLTQPETGAIVERLGFRSSLHAASAAEGSRSLIARGLMVTEGGETRPSEDLGTALGPVMLAEELLAVVRRGSTGGESSGLYFARGGIAVSLKMLEAERLSFELSPRKALRKIVAGSLRRPVEGTAVETAEGRALVASLRQLMEWDEALTPRVVGVALIWWTKTKGPERSATVLLHDSGFTWIESGEKARMAYVETQEDLAELVADMIGFGVK